MSRRNIKRFNSRDFLEYLFQRLLFAYFFFFFSRFEKSLAVYRRILNRGEEEKRERETGVREKGKASREWKRVKTGGGGDGRRSIFQVHVSQPHLIYPLFPSLFLRPSLSLFAFIFPDSDPFLLPPLARPSFLPLLPSPPFLPSFSASSSVLLLHHRIHPPASPFSDTVPPFTTTTLANHSSFPTPFGYLHTPLTTGSGCSPCVESVSTDKATIDYVLRLFPIKILIFPIFPRDERKNAG